MEPFLGEIRVFSFPFAPKGWALCNGQILPINQNMALFSLLGTTYGGNGQTTFALPDLRGRTPVHVDYSYASVALGQSAGEENHTLAINEMPAHNHLAYASNVDATTKVANGNFWAQNDSGTFASNFNGQMSQQALKTSGGSQPHLNMQPYMVFNFCIALTGLYPTRN